MKIYSNLDEIEYPKEGTAVALGAFDGLHLGHRKVIESTLGTEFTPSVFTFSEDPSMALSGSTEYLMTQEDKSTELEEMGIKNEYSVSFDSVKGLSPEEFFYSILVEKLNAKLICCGENFRFGKNAAGNTDTLGKLCEENGIRLKVCSPVTLDGDPISSTAIRNALKEGNTALAEKMLGKPFGFTLEVVTGNRLGRTIGVPTINQVLPEGFVKPKFGVYAAVVHIGKMKYWAVCNIGVKPTIGSYAPLSETWIGDFDGDLYGEKLRLDVHDFIRPEKKFGSLDELKVEIKKNAVTAKELLKNRIL